MNGKNKGSAFERLVCKKLSLWVSNNEHEDCFWRSAMSGGRATVAAKGGKKLSAHAGDITATHHLGKLLTDLFCIECKFYKSLDLHLTLYGKEAKIGKFWKKLCGEAKLHGKEPLLIAKENGKPILAMTSVDGAYLLSQSLLIGDKTLFSIHSGDIEGFLFDDVLASSFDDIRKQNV